MTWEKHVDDDTKKTLMSDVNNQRGPIQDIIVVENEKQAKNLKWLFLTNLL